MKKTISMIIILIFTCGLMSGCDPATYYFNSEELSANVTKIELVYCENNNPQNIEVKCDTVLQCNLEDYRFVQMLEAYQLGDFIHDLSTITFHIENYSVESPIGYAVIIHLRHDQFIVLSCTSIDKIAYGMAAQFTESGEFVKHIASFADRPKFERLLEKYFSDLLM